MNYQSEQIEDLLQMIRESEQHIVRMQALLDKLTMEKPIRHRCSVCSCTLPPGYTQCYCSLT